MRCACIDVGSNTTRLLVADARVTDIKKVGNDRAFTLIGRSLDAAGRIPPGKIDETATVVARQVELATELGAEQIRAVATAAIRNAANPQDLVAAVERRAGVTLEVLTGEAEAGLAFRGAANAVDADGLDVRLIGVRDQEASRVAADVDARAAHAATVAADRLQPFHKSATTPLQTRV